MNERLSRHSKDLAKCAPTILASNFYDQASIIQSPLLLRIQLANLANACHARRILVRRKRLAPLGIVCCLDAWCATAAYVKLISPTERRRRMGVPVPRYH